MVGLVSFFCFVSLYALRNHNPIILLRTHILSHHIVAHYQSERWITTLYRSTIAPLSSFIIVITNRIRTNIISITLFVLFPTFHTTNITNKNLEKLQITCTNIAKITLTSHVAIIPFKCCRNWCNYILNQYREIFPVHSFLFTTLFYNRHHTVR